VGKLRKPFFVVSLAAILLALILELGATSLVGAGRIPAAAHDQMGLQVGRMLDDPSANGTALPDQERNEIVKNLKARMESAGKPPGLAIPGMALLDGLLVFTVALIGISLVMPERVHVKYQALATFVASLIVLILALALISSVWLVLTIMIGLFTAAPFGTIAYLAKWGFFDRPGAAAVLSVIMTFKLVFVCCLVAAHQRFLQNRGLVLLILTSLVANVVVTFLHGLVPIFLVSITDSISAIIVGILAAIWSVVLLVGAIFALIKLIF